MKRKIVKTEYIDETKEADEFWYGDSEDLGFGRHRQEIIYKGKGVGYFLYIHKNMYDVPMEKYIIPDIEYGIVEGNSKALIEGKNGWIEFKVFDDYEAAFHYVSQNLERIAYLWKYGDFD